MLRSATGVKLVAAVVVLLPGTLSVVVLPTWPVKVWVVALPSGTVYGITVTDVPPLITLVTVMVRVVPSGNTTVAVTLLAVLGPLLVMVTVALIVWPGVALAGTVIPMLRSATALTKSAATAGFAFVPTVVASAPAAMVFVRVPETELVTTDVIVQLALGAMTVPTGSVSDPAPASADTEPDVQPAVVTTDGLVLTKPAG